MMVFVADREGDCLRNVEGINNEEEDGASGRITRLRLALRVVAKATLFSLVLAIISQNMKQQFICYLGEDGASGRIRTSDRSVRSRVLYPAELRMHRETYFTADFDTAAKAVSSKMVHPGG